jgi:hypothetical protein
MMLSHMVIRSEGEGQQPAGRERMRRRPVPDLRGAQIKT